MAMASNIIHISSGDDRLATNCPKNQRTPSPLSNERKESSGMAAVTSHDTNITSTCKALATKAIRAKCLFIIGHEIVDVNNSKFQCPYHQTGSVYTHIRALGKELLHKFILT